MPSPAAQPATFVGRDRELVLVRAAYPVGTEDVIGAPPDGRALAYLYVVAAPR